MGVLFCFIGKIASGDLLNEKGPLESGHGKILIMNLEKKETIFSEFIIKIVII